MTATKLKNIITKKISEIEDIKILISINQLLESKSNVQQIYRLNEVQRKKIRKSQLEFEAGKTISNEKVFDEVEKWLKEK